MRSAVTSQTPVLKNQEMHAKKNVDISRGDYFLFGSNVACLAACVLDDLGYDSQLFRTVTNVTQLAAVLGESLVSAPSFDRFYSALPGLALFGMRLFIDHQAQSNLSLKILSLGLNAYGVCILAKKAIAEAVKCYQLSSKGQISNSEIAKVYVIHGTNTIAALFRTLISYKTLSFLESAQTIADKAKNAYQDKYPRANAQDIKNFGDKINELVERIKQGRLNPDACTAGSELHAMIDEVLYDNCVGSGWPTWDEMANNRITNDVGSFTRETLASRGHRNCFSSWKEYYQKYPDQVP